VRALLLAAAVSLAGLGCTTGEGSGSVESRQLFVEGCWNGPFDLDPTFFAALPTGQNSLIIRVQRGDDFEEVSDGLAVLVNDLEAVRASRGVALDVGVPRGVSPPGVPIELDPDPPKVNLTLYLHDTCHLQNGAIYSTEGTITFQSLFSGDPSESNAEDRLTEATFSATFADPRKLAESGSAPTSVVFGNFSFYFQRGQPAQTFP
jgi:hypothetical protein